ncbi:MAG: acetyl-CoA carboxylase biotin carboxyl carrier protein subunit [Melioribacteraceae bacterium]|nr:acetyl-CoA carboxylase biotin carboxyl carrier protein subunit [Melioribacteraceae bacterium]
MRIKNLKVTLSKVSNYLYLIKIDDKIYEVTTTRKNHEEFHFSIDGRHIETTVRSSLQEQANKLLKEKDASSDEDTVKAPMPGLILKILKSEGDEVELGEPIILLEAMKMENEIRSSSAGKIKKLYFNDGDSVEKNVPILLIEKNI